MSDIFDKILNEVSLDSRITSGVFSIEEESHMDVLREFLTKRGIAEEAAKEFCNRVVEGKFPERQAYNKEGILVTFPTPEYKARAIKKGTHFEKDPTKRAPNIFGGAEAPQQATAPAGGAEKQPQPTGKTSLSLSQTATAPPPESPDQKPPDQAEQPVTSAAPAATASAEEPPAEPTDLPPPPEKSDAEKEANKQAIIKMIKSNDAMLERVVEYILHKGSPTLVNDLYKQIL